MSEIDCEKVQLAIMAESDAEETIPGTQIKLHLADCDNCRSQLEQMQEVDQLLKRQTRGEQDVDLWPAIHRQIGRHEHPKIGWRPFAVFGVLLVGDKLFEMLPAEDPGLGFRLLPLVFIVGLFVFLRENPFKINTELMLGR
jgi:hypothetical protein